MRRQLARLLALLALLIAAPALAETVASGSSPDGSITVTVSLNNDGRPSYSVTRRGKPVIADSALGFLFTDARKWDRGLEAIGTSRASADTTWRQPWGEWATIRDRHNELTVRLREKADARREIDLVFRLFDDGVGFRYVFPRQTGFGTVHIADELTEFALPGPDAGSGPGSGASSAPVDAIALWKPAFEWNREEYLYHKSPFAEVGTAATPITLRLADGTHLAIHEAALVDYAGMNLRRADNNRLRAVLTPGSGAPAVTRDAPFATPWRTIIIGDDAPGLYMSHIELNLNAPSQIADTSWIRPGKFVGVWWNMIKGDWTWATGPRHGATDANVRRYIDFAAANGIPGVLVEGWNVGWDGDWFGNGNAMQFDQPTPDFHADALAAYAQGRGVYLIGHNETGGSASHYDDQLDRAFAFARAHGERVVKTGYVTDAGQIERVDADGTQHREWHEGQWMVNHYLRVVQTAARYHVGIDSHEPVKDTGLRRTWPNWLAREGSRGMEYNAWAGKNPPEHESNLFFTRMLEGPMDFTPGVLSLKGSDNSDILSTVAKQLALYVVLYSPVQMLADTPEHYTDYPQLMPFLRAVPVDWADTRVLAGELGDFVAVARKDRNGPDWYLGAVGDEQAREITVRLDFLDAGRAYTAEIYRDGPGATYANDARHSVVVERRQVRRGETMTLSLAPGGGQAIRFVAPGRRR